MSKIKCAYTPIWYVTWLGKKHSKSKLFVEGDDGKIHTSFTSKVERLYTAYCARIAKELIIQTSSERKRCITACNEYLRKHNSSTDDPIEQARLKGELSDLSNEIILLNNRIETKIIYVEKSVSEGLCVYRNMLTAYYSGMSTSLEIGPNRMIDLSERDTPYSVLVLEWADERQNVNNTIATFREGRGA